jgi:Ca2+-binding EF-hand superfamily protein
MTFRHSLASVLLFLLLSAPAMAQNTDQETAMTAAECNSMFAEADKNGDGVLSQEEIAAAEIEGLQPGITRSQFVAECQG